MHTALAFDASRKEGESSTAVCVNNRFEGTSIHLLLCVYLYNVSESTVVCVDYRFFTHNMNIPFVVCVMLLCICGCWNRLNRLNQLAPKHTAVRAPRDDITRAWTAVPCCAACVYQYIDTSYLAICSWKDRQERYYPTFLCAPLTYCSFRGISICTDRCCSLGDTILLSG